MASRRTEGASTSLQPRALVSERAGRVSHHNPNSDRTDCEGTRSQILEVVGLWAVSLVIGESSRIASAPARNRRHVARIVSQPPDGKYAGGTLRGIRVLGAYLGDDEWRRTELVARVERALRDDESAMLSVDVCARLRLRRLDSVRRLVALAVPSLFAVGEAKTRRLAGERAARSHAACACLRRLLGGGGRPPLGLADALSAWRTVSRRRRAPRGARAGGAPELEQARASLAGQRPARRRERTVAALLETTSEAQAVLAAGVEGPRSFAQLPAAAAARRAIGSLKAATAAYDADTRLAQISDAASPRAEARRRACDALARLQEALRGALGEARDAEERDLERHPPGRPSDPGDGRELLRHEAARAAREAAEAALREGWEPCVVASAGAKSAQKASQKAAEIVRDRGENKLTRAQYLDEGDLDH